MRPIKGMMSLFVVLLLILAACGDGDTDQGAGGEATEPPATEPTEPAEGTEDEGAEDEGGVDGDAATEDAAAETCTELTPVKLAVPAPSLNFVAYYLGAEEGIFESHCIDLEIEVVRGDAAVAALMADEIDFTAAGGTAMRAALEGAPVRAVMITVAESTTSLVVQPEIESTSDIKGADIAVLGTGDSLAVALNEWLRSEGLDPQRDVNLLTVNSTPDAFSTLVGGAVDGAMLTPPFDAQAENEGMRVLVQVSDFFAGSQGQVATTTEKIEQDPETVKRFINGALDSINLMVDDPDRAVEFVVEFLEMEEAVAQRSMELFAPAMATDGMASTEALLSQLPEGTTEEDLDNTVDFSLLEEVLAERG